MVRPLTILHNDTLTTTSGSRVAFYLDNEKCDYVEGDALDSDSSSTSRLVLGSVGSDKSSPLSNLKWLKPFRGWIKQFIKNDQ